MRVTFRSIAASVDVSFAHRRDEGVAPGPLRPGHGQVLIASRAFEGADSRPIADHDAVETPFVLQRRGEQIVLRCGHAVDGVVCAHHQPRAGFADRRFEREQVELVKSTFVDPHIDREPLGFGVVGDVVLDRRTHSEALDAAHVLRREFRREDRILAEGLEVPTAIGGSVEIDRRREDDIDVLPPCLRTDRLSHSADQFPIPRGCQRGGGGEVHGRGALVPRVTPDPCRSVGDHDGPQSNLGQRMKRPRIAPGEQQHFVLEAQSPDECVQLDFARIGHRRTPSVSTTPPP